MHTVAPARGKIARRAIIFAALALGWLCADRLGPFAISAAAADGAPSRLEECLGRADRAALPACAVATTTPPKAIAPHGGGSAALDPAATAIRIPRSTATSGATATRTPRATATAPATAARRFEALDRSVPPATPTPQPPAR